MKMKILSLSLLLAVLAVLLIPQVGYADDGGSIYYDAVLYEYCKVHSMRQDEQTGQDGYLVGHRLSVFGIEVYEAVHFEAK